LLSTKWARESQSSLPLLRGRWRRAKRGRGKARPAHALTSSTPPRRPHTRDRSIPLSCIFPRLASTLDVLGYAYVELYLAQLLAPIASFSRLFPFPVLGAMLTLLMLNARATWISVCPFSGDATRCFHFICLFLLSAGSRRVGSGESASYTGFWHQIASGSPCAGVIWRSW
jgi:hypothetical protein